MTKVMKLYNSLSYTAELMKLVQRTDNHRHHRTSLMQYKCHSSPNKRKKKTPDPIGQYQPLPLLIYRHINTYIGSASMSSLCRRTIRSPQDRNCTSLSIQVYTKEWCGFHTKYIINRTILLCIPCICTQTERENLHLSYRNEPEDRKHVADQIQT